MIPSIKKFFFISLVPTVIFISGCTSINGNWGGNTTFLPGWKIINDSAIAAVKDPLTWAPLLGAAAFGLADFDQKTVDWATRDNPIFGDMENAKDSGNLLRDISRGNYLFTALAAPSGQGTEGFINKSRGLLFGIQAIAINTDITNLIKSTAGRKRPNQESTEDEDYSFPSFHTSSASISARLASRNIETMNLTQQQKTFWQVSSYTAAGLTGWARVESGRHYPSDVLVGYALGNFLGAFLNDAFIDPEYQESITISATANNSEERYLSITYTW